MMMVMMMVEVAQLKMVEIVRPNIYHSLTHELC